MSVLRRSSIRCDGHQAGHEQGADLEGHFRHCEYWMRDELQGSINAENERKTAASKGWTRRGKLDLCPTCTARYPAP